MEKIRIQYYEPVPAENDIIEAEYTEKEETPTIYKPPVVEQISSDDNSKRPKKKKSRAIPILTGFLVLALVSVSVQGYVMYKQYNKNKDLDKKIVQLNETIVNNESKIEELTNEIKTKDSKIKELSKDIASQEKSIEEKEKEKTDLEKQIQKQRERYQGIAQTISNNLDRESYDMISSYKMLEKMSDSWKNRLIKVRGTILGSVETAPGMYELTIDLNGNYVLLKYHYDAIGVEISQNDDVIAYGKYSGKAGEYPLLDLDFIEKI